MAREDNFKIHEYSCKSFPTVIILEYQISAGVVRRMSSNSH